MTLSRWKMMAVGLGVSLGGLAAIAGQCPKIDSSKGSRTADALPALEAPVIPVAASAPKAMPPTAPVPDLPPLPSGTPPVLPKVDTLPDLPAPPANPAAKPDTPVSSPAIPPVLPIGGTEPTKVAPAIPDLPAPAPSSPTRPATPPAPPATTGDLPKPLNEPSAPPAGIIYSKPAPPATAPSDPLIGTPTRVSPPSPGSTPPATRGPDLPSSDPPPMRAVTVPDGGTTSMEIKHAKPATKFRILLRVGEGEPTFEVRCGDDLVLKVACEKVDVKSPEKGNGLSAVKASGKVRFAGFGAEGTCDELSFLAGSGEVVLVGGVNIKVKDKLGRVESELSADSAKYKLDPCPTGSR